MFATKRKTFDSRKHRIIDGEHANLLKYSNVNNKKNLNSNINNAIPKNNYKKAGKWKKQSEEFRAAIRASNIINKNIKGGNMNNLSNIPQVKMNYDDYVHCNYCNRKYNENAYNKHLNFCMKKAKDSSMRPKMNTSMKPNLNMRFKK